MTLRAARAAHELRTPLHGILGAAELLRAGALDDAQRGHVATIEEAARALLRVADDAIAAASQAASQAASHETLGEPASPVPPLDAVAAPCDPRAVLDGVRRLLAPAAEARGLALAAVADDAVPACVAVDAGRLRQLLVNLAGNAVKFAAAGAVTLAVRPAPDAPDALAFEVRDGGPGLPPAALAALAGGAALAVRPDAPGTRPGGGAGLGLSIVAELAAALGGTLAVESDDAGTTVRATIPAPAALPARARVLVVDDDAVSRRVTAQLLAALGCDVGVAADAQTARVLASRNALDLIVLDVQLPDADGCELAAELRARDRGAGRPATPVVALTAHADDALRARSAAAGIAECLQKPSGRDALAAVLARHAAPALDPDHVARLVDLEGDAPGLLARVAADYADGAARRLDELARAVAAGDGAALARAAHALLGASASAGAVRVAACVASLPAMPDAAALARLGDEVRRAAAALARLNPEATCVDTATQSGFGPIFCPSASSAPGSSA